MSRDALDHHLLQDGERFRAWFWLVANAAWRPTKARIKGETVTVNRGELSFSVRFLADNWGWSKSRVDRFLSDLRAEGMIETRSKIGTTAGHKAGQGQSIITICNYSKYQDIGNRGWDNDDAETGTSAGQQRDKEEQGNKGTSNQEEGLERARENDSTPDPVQPEPVNDDPPEGPPAKPVRRKRAPKALPSIDLPDWVPAEPWNAFVDMRVGKGATPTEHAMHLLIGKLEKFRAQGHSPGDVLNQSTLNNWTDLYPLKDKTDDRGKANHGSSPGSYRQHDNRDGLQRHLDRKLGVDGYDHTGEPSGKAGRYDAGESEDDSAGRVARVIPLR